MPTYYDYLTAARAALELVAETQGQQIRAAASLFAKSVLDDGVIQGFATGHSRSLTLEMTGRAGGLAPVNMMSIKDLAMWGGWDPGAIMDPKLERDPTLAAALLDIHDVRPADVFLIASNSGQNEVVVEMAYMARVRGHLIVGVTSRAAYAHIPARHSSGLKLADVADVVIDTCVPYGDVVLPVAGQPSTGGLSSLVSVFVAQSLTVETVRLLQAGNHAVPIYRSANLPEGDEHNDPLVRRYGTRVRPMEP